MFRRGHPQNQTEFPLPPNARRFSLGRALAVIVVVVLFAETISWYLSYLRPVHRPANSIMVLMPYKHAGTWVFDDPAVGLRQEPFVAGIPEMVDEMVKDIPDADKGFRLLFSAQPFPGYSHKLTWLRGDLIGNFYYSEDYKKEGWLCPALFKYYRKAPKEIYVKAERK